MFGVEDKEEKLFSNEDVRIAIVGVGGGGCNTVNRIESMGIKHVNTIAVNTDNLHLLSIKAQKKVLIGRSITKGLGAGGFPEVAEKCAEVSKDEIAQAVGENELVFLVSGLGGGTGTGASPLVARIAKEQGAIVVSIVTTPFSLERSRLKKAEWGLERLVKESDAVVVIDNNRLSSYAQNLPITEAFYLADVITAKAVKGITETIVQPSLMNIDFADVKSVMENGGVSLISLGEGSGPDRVEMAAKKALEHPLLDVSFEGAKAALIHIEANASLTLGEAYSLVEKITENFALDANVKFGARLTPIQSDTILTTTIITGLKSEAVQKVMGSQIAQQQKVKELAYLEAIGKI
ncbi:MAG: cell division protein FtsZ [Candidatus Micrarchaeota archaeon]|nr:cell division protein FtsZ [Candidatus Micrarchaeota archaeon]